MIMNKFLNDIFIRIVGIIKMSFLLKIQWKQNKKYTQTLFTIQI